MTVNGEKIMNANTTTNNSIKNKKLVRLVLFVLTGSVFLIKLSAFIFKEILDVFLESDEPNESNDTGAWGLSKKCASWQEHPWQNWHGSDIRPW